MTEYIRKPEKFVFIKWDGTNLQEIQDFFGGSATVILNTQNNSLVTIPTPYGPTTIVPVDSWILQKSSLDTGVEFYSNDEFISYYEEAPS